MSNLQALRKAAGHTQQSLAEACNVNLRTIQKLEYGESDTRRMALETALLMAKALGVSPDKLIEE